MLAGHQVSVPVKFKDALPHLEVLTRGIKFHKCFQTAEFFASICVRDVHKESIILPKKKSLKLLFSYFQVQLNLNFNCFKIPFKDVFLYGF